MGRILIIYPREGLVDLLKQVLRGEHDFSAFASYGKAAAALAAGESFDAVLCGLENPKQAIQVFGQALKQSPITRLIPIADRAEQVSAFVEQWNSSPPHQTGAAKIGRDWLPRRCTAGEILALFSSAAAMPVNAAAAEAPTPSPAPRGLASQAPKPAAVTAPIGSGTLVDGYRLMRVIGQGGFGATWLAVNETSGRRVALKCVEAEEQVAQEIDALQKYVPVAAGCKHLLQYEHIHQEGRRLWLVTALADSLTGDDTPDAYRPMSLALLLQAHGHLPEKEAVAIARCLLEALAVLHHGGLLHGDVAAGNVLRIRNRWVLADPGLVRWLGEPGLCRNRRYYPQPQPVRPSDDLYALGMLLWEITSGVAELPSGNERVRLDANLLAFLLRSELPIARFLCKAVAEAPEQRYLNAQEMSHDLAWLERHLAAKTSPVSALYDLPKLRSLRTNCGLPPLEP